ncbi:MAG: pimeloyl-ACP methyl ester carboxylesterase [Cognaticolwellia sp.]|jgi:pimeloyl-ACP methyl ester carboxylesterase
MHVPLILLLSLSASLTGCTESTSVPGSDGLESLLIQAEDGVQIHLHHLPGSQGPPVLMVHGVSSNHHSFRLSDGRGYAEAALAAGLDPWLLDLRGRGRDRGDPSAGWLQGNAGDLDDYAALDLPAAIAEIQRQTGAEDVGYIGHSMGGMVGAIYLATTPEPPLYAFVALGSPVAFDRLDPLNRAAMAAARHSPLPWVDSELGGQLRAQIGGSPLTPVDAFVDKHLFNDIAPEQRPTLYAELSSPMTRGEMRHLGQLAESGGLGSADGTQDHLAPLADVRLPAQVWAGAADLVAPPWQVQPMADHLGQASYVLAGTESGFAVDYGHLDLILGDNAANEVYPMLNTFLLQASHAAR